MKREKGQGVTDQAIALVNRVRAARVPALKAACDHVDKAIRGHGAEVAAVSCDPARQAAVVVDARYTILTWPST
jgi:hypothetical protein